MTPDTEYELLKQAGNLYLFDPKDAVRFPSHEGGRNIVYAIGPDRVLRVSSLRDRSMRDYLAETGYIHFLKQGGASVADVIASTDGQLAEKISIRNTDYAVSLFERAPGDQIAEHGYRYREGAPIEEYWNNCGKTLGRIHALSKNYAPETPRFDFFERYNESYFDMLIPDDLVCELLGPGPVGGAAKAKLHDLLDRLRALPRDSAHWGMIHFDFSDGNYNIDYTNGRITVFDFDNCRTGPYLFDLANLWTHGVGWTARQPDAEKRKAYMDRYYDAVLQGYLSETDLPADTAGQLLLLIEAVRMENIIDEFETLIAGGEELSCDGEQTWRIKGLLEDIPWIGFFSADYDPASPFDLDP